MNKNDFWCHIESKIETNKNKEQRTENLQWNITTRNKNATNIMENGLFDLNILFN